MRITKFVKRWLPLLAWMGVIFIISSLPAKNIPPVLPFQDIAYHLGAYAILGCLLRRATGKNIPLTVIFAFIYALSDELHQTFVPGRSFSGLDLAIDGAGAFLGSLRYL